MPMSKVYKRVKYDPMRDKVVEAIKNSGMTDAQICRKTGITPKTLKKWKDGRVRFPQHLTMAFVLKALGKEFKIDWIGGNE